MASSINASTSGAGGVITTADNTGILNIQTAGTNAVTITASQNVGIGTTSPGGSSTDRQVSIVGSTSAQMTADSGTVTTNFGSNSSFGYIQNPGAYPLLFYTSNLERMRIASNGYVGINTVSTLNPLSVRSSANNLETGLFENTASSGNVRGILSAIGNNGNSTNSFHYAGLTQGVSFWYLYGNGTSSWTSDERKKKNIETTRDGYIDDLCKLRVVKYNWKTDEDDKPKELGLIAQEVEQIFPGLIQDALHEDIDGVKYKTIKGSVLPYMLLKAIQEQQTIINDLKARIETLEAK